MRVAEEVRVLMTRQRVKQADLAAVLNVQQPQISQRLNGRVEYLGVDQGEKALAVGGIRVTAFAA